MAVNRWEKARKGKPQGKRAPTNKSRVHSINPANNTSGQKTHSFYLRKGCTFAAVPLNGTLRGSCASV